MARGKASTEQLLAMVKSGADSPAKKKRGRKKRACDVGDLKYAEKVVNDFTKLRKLVDNGRGVSMVAKPSSVATKSGGAVGAKRGRRKKSA